MPTKSFLSTKYEGQLFSESKLTRLLLAGVPLKSVPSRIGKVAKRSWPIYCTMSSWVNVISLTWSFFTNPSIFLFDGGRFSLSSKKRNIPVKLRFVNFFLVALPPCPMTEQEESHVGRASCEECDTTYNFSIKHYPIKRWRNKWEALWCMCLPNKILPNW